MHHWGGVALPVGHPPPLVGLCRVRVDADGSVAVSDGRVGLLHLDVDAAPQNGKSHQDCDVAIEHSGGDIRASPRPFGVQDGQTGVHLDGFSKKIQSFLQVSYTGEIR